MLTITISRVRGRRHVIRMVEEENLQILILAKAIPALLFLTPINTVLNLHKWNCYKYRSKFYSHIASHHMCAYGTHVYIQYV